MRRWLCVLALASAPLLAACGESEKEEALADVCDARADIDAQIDDLQGLRITPAAEGDVTQGIDAIDAAVLRITDVSDQLAEEQQQQVDHATSAFLPVVDKAVALSASVNTNDPRFEQRYEGLFGDLARSYEETLANISCE